MDGYDDISTNEADRNLARELRDHFNVELWCVLLAAFKVEASRCGLALELAYAGGKRIYPERWLLDRLGASMLEARRRHIMPFGDVERIRVTAAEISDGYAYRWASTMIRALGENGRNLVLLNEAEYKSAELYHDRYMSHRLKPERGVIHVRAASAAEAYSMAVEQRRREAASKTAAKVGDHRVVAGSSNDGL